MINICNDNISRDIDHVIAADLPALYVVHTSGVCHLQEGMRTIKASAI